MSVDHDRDDSRPTGPPVKPGRIWAHAWSNGGKPLVIAAAVFAFTLGGLATLAVGRYVDSQARVAAYAPIRYPRVQKVLTPVVRNGLSVETDARRCSKATTTLTVNGGYAWVSLAPSGFIYRTSVSSAMVGPGCQRIHYLNSMPAEVVAVNARLFGQGLRQVQWRLEGHATPVDPDGKPGVAALWHTTIFTVIP